MPPPPKAKMFAKTGKHKTINTSASSAPVPQASTSTATPAADVDAQAQQSQLELELVWCVQTLEASIDSGKLNAKQVADVNKTIQILKSAKQPIIKKRQVMRTAFGDYRAKMAAEERKMRQSAPRIEFTERTPSLSYFVKKSALQSLGQSFKFEFPVADQLNELDLNAAAVDAAEPPVAASVVPEAVEAKKVVIEPQQTQSKSVMPLKSDGNTFKFNFDVEME